MIAKRQERERWAEEMVKAWLPRLGLTEWFVQLRWVNLDDPNTLARITWTPQYRSAVISLNTGVNDSWWQFRPLQHAMVHELCHLLLVAVEDVMHQQTTGILLTLLNGAAETVVDSLATLFLAAYPVEG